eukprot:gene14200-16793_t
MQRVWDATWVVVRCGGAAEEKQSAELRARAAEEEARQMRLKLQKIEKKAAEQSKDAVHGVANAKRRQWKMLQSRFSPEPDENEEDEDMRKSASERNWDSLMANMKLPSLDGSQVMNLKQKVASMKIRKNTSYISPYAPEIIKLERELSKRKKQPGESSLMQSK